MTGRVEWIRRTERLEAALRRVGRGPLALDTESDSLHRYPERVCLVQLSFAGRDLLVDPLAGVDVRVLAPALEAPEPRKILHGADYDLRVLQRDFGLRVRGLFDTMVAARLAGERSFGLAALLERHFGIRLEKKFQRADWSRRPLPPAMVEYAARDTRHLEALARGLRERLEALGRVAWAEEEFRRLEEVRWQEEEEREAFRRIRGSAKLDRRGLAILREAVAVRERLARERGRPPFTVLGNRELVELAREGPRSPRAVPRLPALARAREADRRRFGEAVRRALELPESALPAPHRGVRPPKDPRREARLREVIAGRDAVARRLGIEPAVLAPRSTLEKILARLEGGGEPGDVPELRRWQLEQLAPVLGS